MWNLVAYTQGNGQLWSNLYPEYRGNLSDIIHKAASHHQGLLHKIIQ